MLKKILLAASYFLVAAVIAGGTLALVAYGQGLSYDFKSHKLVSNGLLIMDSKPNGAGLSVNGKYIRRDTPFRKTFRIGQYNLKLYKQGYREWTKRVNIIATQVVDLTDIILVPLQIRKTPVKNSGGAVTVVPSSDRKHVAYVTDGANPGLWRLDVGAAVGTKVYTPAAATGNVPAQHINSASLSRDGSHALVRVQQADGVHVLLVDMNGGATTDLTTTFKVSLDDVRFSADDWRQLYWLSGDGLRKIDAEAKTISAVLADKVVAYTYAGDRIIYIQSTKVGKTIAVMDRNGDNAKTLVEGLAESDAYQLVYAHYRDKETLAVVPSVNRQLTIYENIYSDNVVGRVVTRDVSKILASDDGHYIVFAHSTGYGSYDVQRTEITDGVYKGTIDDISWFNEAHVVFTSGGKTYLGEHDGYNVTEIGASVGSSSVGMYDVRHIVYVKPAATSAGAVTRIEIADLKK